jgi:hypothetical protein
MSYALGRPQEDIIMAYVRYSHKGEDVFVRHDMKGREKDYSLCTNCQNIKDDCDEQSDAMIGAEKEVVLIVWACPDFFPAGAKKVLQFQGEEFELK